MQNTSSVLAIICVTIIIIVFACQPNVSIKTAQYAVNGQKLYATHCQNCHGSKGEGLGTLYPPLTDTTYINTNRARLACIIKNGMNETITVDGESFTGPMPSITSLTKIEIAYILTYITTSFAGNTEIFSQEEVSKSLSTCK